MSNLTNIYILFIISLLFNSCIAQKKVLERDENGKIYKKLVFNDKKIIKAYFITESGNKIEIEKQVDVVPTFFEGNDKIQQFIENNLIYPKNFEIHVSLTFAILVDSVGNISHVRLLKKTFNCIDCITNALNVIKKMKWIAGKNKLNKSVISIKYLTIGFK
jgi:hypothetical protein